MTGKAPVLLRVARRFEAAPERVFDAWLDPAQARHFLFATPDGEMLRCEIDPRIGGRFRIVERRGGQDAEHHGEYLEIDRPRRLVFSFSVEMHDAKADRVTIEIVPRGSGCELTLTHEMKPEWAEHAPRAEQGWAMILGSLAARLA